MGYLSRRPAATRSPKKLLRARPGADLLKAAANACCYEMQRKRWLMDCSKVCFEYGIRQVSAKESKEVDEWKRNKRGEGGGERERAVATGRLEHYGRRLGEYRTVGGVQVYVCDLSRCDCPSLSLALPSQSRPQALRSRMRGSR